MKYSNNAVNILTAKTYKRIGRAWIVKNFRGNESIKTVVSLLNGEEKESYIITEEDFLRRREKIIEEIVKQNDFIDGVIALGDENFPKARGDVKNSEQPIVLFYRGDLTLLEENNKNITVIGLLNPDPNTEIREQEVVAELVKNGATVISGLALGCDTIAHQQAMDSNGKTVAILPSPLFNILPAVNIKLANQIVESNGLLITEYYNNVKSRTELSGRYQERDRLQALFSNAVILSASYAKNNIGNDSGSRLAMEYALNYSIPRAVIYDSIIDENNPKYDLSRQLIKEQKEITVINRGNLLISVKKIMSIKPKIKSYQLNVYDLMQTIDASN